MPVYSYKGIATSGKAISGVKDADNVRALKLVLKRDGVFITDVREANLKAEEMKRAAGTGLLALLSPTAALNLLRFRRDANRQQVAVLTRQLGVLLKAGVPLAESLGALVDQS